MERIIQKLQSISLLFIIVLMFYSCKTEQRTTKLKEGVYRGIIHMQGQELPFNFKLYKEKDKLNATLINGKNENLPLDEISLEGDSVFITLHIFDIDLRARILGDSLKGFYIKNYKDNYKVPFTAVYGDDFRFKNPQANTTFDGKWQITFKENDSVSYPAIGIFKKDGPILTGTFLTETGDYRYLEGFSEDNKMSLFTFDGNHAFIFNANLNGDKLNGTFHSGLDYKESFTGFKNEAAKLEDADKLTFLNEGYDKVEFSFPGLDGKNVSLEDPKFKNKVVLLQIFGTWCPNCMDETKFYANWYENNKDKDVEILGLAYEAKADFEYAKARVEKMKEKYKVGYDYVIAGVYDKKEAAKTLPMLNHVLSFPTTIFIDKNGTVRRIHTGFSGPATGKYYEDFVDDFNSFMNVLLKE